MRIGIDVGGTNTDAVLMHGHRLGGWYKTPTTPNVISGITTALSAVLRQARAPAEQIDAVVIGSTHFINALLERSRLMPVGAIRLGLPSTSSLPPMVDWPADLRRSLGDHIYLAHGGTEFDNRPIAQLDPAEIRAIARDLARLSIRSVAITAVFSPVNATMELQAADIIRRELPDASISLSHEIGRIGLLERENAAIVNACLRDLARQSVDSFQQALRDLAITAPLYISQNDGTLMGAAFAERYPVLTFASGSTNSMRGAAFLSGLDEAMVVDIGGTTTDVGMLSRGFPRESTAAVDVGGVRTNMRMPDVCSIALGGGSIVRIQGGDIHIGPESVGYELPRRALVFGGDTLTATDIAVAAGLADLGDRAAVAHLPARQVGRAIAQIQQQIAAAVDQMRTSPDPLPVVVVGGGSFLARAQVFEAAEVIIPPHHAVANAIGAAIAQVGGETDRVVALDALTRAAVLEQARQEAIGKVLSAGADPASARVVDLDEVPLSYLPGNVARLRVKAVGDLFA